MPLHAVCQQQNSCFQQQREGATIREPESPPSKNSMWSQRDKKSKPCTQDPALPVTRSASKIFIQMKIIYSVLASSKVYMNLSSLIFFTAKINGGFSWYTSEFYFHLVYYFKDTCCRSISLMKCTAHLACLRVLFQCHRDKPCTAALTRLALHRLC